MQEAAQEYGNLLTISEAAALKQVSRQSIYRAIAERRLPSVQVLGKMGVMKSDVMAYEPISYRGRPGSKARGGRPKGIPQTVESRARISVSQAARWARRKSITATN